MIFFRISENGSLIYISISYQSQECDSALAESTKYVDSLTLVCHEVKDFVNLVK